VFGGLESALDHALEIACLECALTRSVDNRELVPVNEITNIASDASFSFLYYQVQASHSTCTVYLYNVVTCSISIYYLSDRSADKHRNESVHGAIEQRSQYVKLLLP
jgi:hypothetical protein